MFTKQHSPHRPAGSLVLALIAIFAVGLCFPRGATANETVRACSPFGNSVFQHAAVFGINTGQICPSPGIGGGGMEIWTAGNTVAAGQHGNWQANAPAGLVIVGASVPSMVSTGVNDGEGYGGGFYWAGGGAETYDGEAAAGFGPLWSSYFGFQLKCGASPCRSGTSQLDVGEADLYVQETVGPALVSPDGLWQSSGWIRGDWNLHFWGDSPSGLCGLSGSISGQAVASASSGQNTAVWHQCSAPAILQTIHTWQYGQGPMSLNLSAYDAAGDQTGITKTIYVDNSPPSVSLSGPTDAPTTAGTQYITATATAGPSGVHGIACSLDGSPYQWHPGASAQIAVQGIGAHHASCYADNNAVTASGARATSAIENWSLSIRQPSVSSVSFSRVVDALRCARKRERIHVPAHWVTAHYHGHKVRVKLPAQTRTVTVVHCHPRIVRRRVRIHGHTRIKIVVLLPHTVRDSSKRIRHGAATSVSGWVGTTQGNALGGVPVRVLTAPDNGQDHFTQAAVATTAADGSWSARLPAGPSRLIEAVYDGDTTVEPSASAPARVIVPAALTMRIHPHTTHWGKTISISGTVQGGYIPAAGELVILRVGWRGGSTEVGHLYTDLKGRFHTRYTFLRGNGQVTYHLWASTAKESDYPYAPRSSRKVAVIVRQ